MSSDDPLATFLQGFERADWARAQLTQGPDAAGAQRLQLRPLLLRGAPHWQAVWKHATKDITENWPAGEGAARIAALLTEGWRSAASQWTARWPRKPPAAGPTSAGWPPPPWRGRRVACACW